MLQTRLWIALIAVFGGFDAVPAVSAQMTDATCMTLVKAEPFYPGESNPQTSQQDSDFVYIVTNNKPATVIKYSKNDMARVTSVLLHRDVLNATGDEGFPGANYVDASAGDADYLYLVTHTNPAMVIKLRKSDLSYVGKIVVPNLGETSLTMRVDLMYLYICTFSNPGKVIKVRKSDMLEDSRKVFVGEYSGFNWLVQSEVDADFLYVCTSDSPGRVLKINKITLQDVGSYTLDAGANLVQTAREDADFLYLGTGDAPGKVIKIEKATMNNVASLTLEMGENMIQTSQIDDHYLYLATNTYSKPARVLKLNKTDLSQLCGFTMPLQYVKPYTSQSDNSFLYLGMRTDPGQLVKVSKTYEVDCQVSEWGAYSDCTKSCEGGTHFRNRSIFVEGMNGGAVCPVTGDVEACSEQHCPMDCEVSRYGDWSLCDEQQGKMFQNRTITMEANHSGKACPPLTRGKNCRVDCKADAWSEWSNCEADGHKRRTRTALVTAKNGGLECPPFEATSICSVNCAVSQWSQWSECDKQTGQQERSRYVTIINKYGGNGCPVLSEYFDCRVHCEAGPWNNYGPCDPVNGEAVRERPIIVREQNEGLPCILEEKAECAVSCLVSSWGIWSNCDDNLGTQKRNRTILSDDVHGGMSCPKTIDFKKCAVSCVVAGWSGWSTCAPLVSEDEEYYTQIRRREIIVDVQNGGIACPNRNETRSCTRDCIVSQWSGYSTNPDPFSYTGVDEYDECSAMCGGGTQSRKRIVMSSPSKYGEACPQLSEERECNTHTCSLDNCIVSSWSDWTDCTTTCGGGQQTRAREITREATGSGVCLERDDLQRSRVCNAQSCDVDCVTSQWTEWGECVKGLGTRARTMSVMVEPQNNGNMCPSLSEQETCQLDCEVSEWDPWSECEGGMKGRARTVLGAAMNGGQACPDLQEYSEEGCGDACDAGEWTPFSDCDMNSGLKTRTREKGTMDCVLVQSLNCVVDCEVSPWSEFGDCDKTIGKRMRTRSLVYQDRNGGASCPPLANADPCIVNCEMSAYSAWSECDKNTGQQLRTRTVAVQPMNGGDLCPTDFEQSQPCAVSCELGDWGVWGECENDQKRRVRPVLIPPRNGGTPCDSLQDIEECGNSVCSFATGNMGAWGDWSPCNQLTGEQQRTRAILNSQMASQCNTKQIILCPVDCVLGTWTAFGACVTGLPSWECTPTSNCTDAATRTRQMLNAARNGGAACGVMEDRKQCVFDCIVGLWGEFQVCNKTTGTEPRHREILRAPENGGVACPPLLQTKGCLVDCEHNGWGQYGSCLDPVALQTGLSSRHLDIVFEAHGQGKACPTNRIEQKDCDVNCTYSTDWGQYGPCNQGSGYETRFRDYEYLGRNDGTPCVLSQAVPCNVACKMSNWSRWDECNPVGLIQSRNRSVASPALHNGTACSPNRTDTKPCTIAVIPTPAPPTPVPTPIDDNVGNEPTPVPTPVVIVTAAPTPSQEALGNGDDGAAGAMNETVIQPSMVITVEFRFNISNDTSVDVEQQIRDAVAATVPDDLLLVSCVPAGGDASVIIGDTWKIVLQPKSVTAEYDIYQRFTQMKQTFQTQLEAEVQEFASVASCEENLEFKRTDQSAGALELVSGAAKTLTSSLDIYGYNIKTFDSTTQKLFIRALKDEVFGQHAVDAYSVVITQIQSGSTEVLSGTELARAVVEAAGGDPSTFKQQKLTLTIAVMCTEADVLDISFRFQVLVSGLRDQEMRRKFALCREGLDLGLQCRFRAYLERFCSTRACIDAAKQVLIMMPPGVGLETKTLSTPAPTPAPSKQVEVTKKRSMVNALQDTTQVALLATLICFIAMIVIGFGVLMRYRRQKAEKQAFFTRLNRADSDNNLLDENDDWQDADDADGSGMSSLLRANSDEKEREMRDNGDYGASSQALNAI